MLLLNECGYLVNTAEEPLSEQMLGVEEEVTELPHFLCLGKMITVWRRTTHFLLDTK